MIDIEKRVKALENENNARKASYPVAGSLVKFVSQTSDTFVKSSSGNNIPVPVRIRFTPALTNASSKSLISLWPQVSTSSNFSTNYPRVFSYNEQQLSDGSIVLNMNISVGFASQTFYIRAIATGSSPGIFTLL